MHGRKLDSWPSTVSAMGSHSSTTISVQHELSDIFLGTEVSLIPLTATDQATDGPSMPKSTVNFSPFHCYETRNIYLQLQWLCFPLEVCHADSDFL